MVDSIRFSPQLLGVLAAFLEDPTEWRYGYDLSRETDLKSGTLYPLLIRLAERQWVESRWQHAEDNGKPRHMYRLTAAGRRSARELLEDQAKRPLKPALQER